MGLGSGGGANEAKLARSVCSTFIYITKYTTYIQQTIGANSKNMLDTHSTHTHTTQVITEVV